MDPRLPPPPSVPGPYTADTFPGSPGAGMPQAPVGVTSAPDPGQLGAALASVDRSPQVPEMDQATDITVDLPAGYIGPDNVLVKSARVRELVGFDEEKLSRVDAVQNYAKYVTMMLSLGVEELGGLKPDADMCRSLLIGDRDALVLGIRMATYGRTYDFELVCPQCDHTSKVVIDLVDDVPVTKLEEPEVREFEIPDTRHKIRVKLLDGFAQEAFSHDIEKKTAAEMATITLANCVIAIDGQPVGRRENDVLRLPSHDRDKILEFLREHQPGPKIDAIPVNCATCNAEYPYRLGLGSLFRF